MDKPIVVARDAFITKYQPDGSKAWTRLLGTRGWDEANALTTVVMGRFMWRARLGAT